MIEYATSCAGNRGTRTQNQIEFQKFRKFLVDHPTCERCKHATTTRMIPTDRGGVEALCKSCKADKAPAPHASDRAGRQRTKMARLMRIAPPGLFSR